MTLTQIYKAPSAIKPVFIVDDCFSALSDMEENSVDCIMTSPPYWGQRQYLEEGIGLEGNHKDYITDLLKITNELKRVLKPSGSFWLNIGDSYHKKSLLGIPWRIALAMTDEQEWTLRNSVIWNKLKGGMDNSKDKLGNVHENIFHFTKSKKYFYDADLIRSKPRQSSVKNGAIVSATGVSGVRYKRQIELSTSLSIEEKNMPSMHSMQCWLMLGLERYRISKWLSEGNKGQLILIVKRSQGVRRNCKRRGITF